MSLAGKVAIVTGTSSGIGHAIALEFLANGAKVLGGDVSAVAPDLATRPGFSGLSLDLTAPDAAARVLEACNATFGPVDVLVNNAGIGNAKPILETSDADFARYLAINLAAPFALARAAIAQMKGRGGNIINISSIFGLIGAASSAAYAPTKAAIIGMTHQLATEYGRDRIRVNAIAPGLIATPLSQGRLDSNEWFRRMMLEGTPLGHPGTAEDIARAARFLASDEASFITGATLPVDGGWSSSKFQPYPRESA